MVLVLSDRDRPGTDGLIAALREQDAADTNVGHKSNADHIRSMTNEELAALLDAFCEVSECRTADEAVCPFFNDCASDHAECDWKVWLKQPYKEDNT